MGFSGDNDDFTGDNVDTELELFTDIDESSVGSRFYRSGRVLRILVAHYELEKIGLGLRGQYYGMSHIWICFSSMWVGFMKFAGLLTTNRPLHPDRNTGA